jgi:hypothetical protein
MVKLYGSICSVLLVIGFFGAALGQPGTLMPPDSNSTYCIGNYGTPNPWPYPAPADAGIINLGSFGAQQVFSISMWVNPGVTQNGISILLDAAHGGTSNWVVQAFGNNTWTWGNMSFNLTPDTWQHLLLTYENGLKKCFINGKLISTINNPISYSGSPNLYLGNWPEGGRRFNGLVDELYITRDVLYTTDFTPPNYISAASSNTFGLWHFDEGTGATISNSAGASTALNNWYWSTRSFSGSSNNTAPTDLNLSSASVNENLPSGTVVGDLSGTDAEGGPFLFTLVEGTGSIDNGSFIIDGSSLKTAAVFDFETKSAYSIRVRVTDSGGLYFEKSFTINVLPSYLPSNGLVGWWPFNGNAKDESGNGNDGVVSVATLSNDRAGKSNSSYYFNGTGNTITVSETPAFEENAHSIACWIKSSDLSPNATIRTDILGKDGTNPRQWVLQVEASGEIRNAVFTNNGEYTFNSSSTIVANQWYHIVKIWDGLVSKTFINGVLSGSMSTQGNMTSASHPIRFGYDPYYSSNTYFGNIDDIGFWNRALTPAEVLSLYQAANTAPTDITLSNSTINESKQTGSVVGALTATDAEGGTITYSLVSGTGDTDNSSFTISGDSLKSAAVFNYNTKSLYPIRVRATDSGGLYTEKEFTINVLPEYLPANGLVGWWPFNGNANDESGSGNNGTVYLANLIADRSGITNSAYSFNNGPDKITVPNSNLLQLKNSFTVSCWIKTLPNTYGTGNEYHTILNKWGGGGDASYMLGINPSGNLFFSTHNNFNTTTVVGNSVLKFDSWYHLSYTQTDSQGKLFINGLLVGERNDMQIPMVMNNYVLFGSNEVPIGYYPSSLAFEGTIDDIAIWNRALTPQEITALYQSGTTEPPASNTVVWKKLLNGSQFPSTEYYFQPYAFNRETRKIYSFHSVKKWLYEMDIDNLTFNSVAVTGIPTFDRAGDWLFNPGNQSVQFWRSGTDNVFQAPVTGGTVTQVGTGSPSSELFGANPVYNGNTTQPAVMHGYGFYTHKNAAYELTNGTWLTKRSNSSEQPYKRGTWMYPNKDFTKAYIIDGQGNPSGNQFESACSLPNGLPWATDVGKYCWLRDIWEINLSDWSVKNILPVNSDFDATGRFGYDFENNVFYSFGGYVPPAVHGQALTWVQSARRFKPGTSGWENLEATGDLPPAGVVGVTYYDELKDRFLFCAPEGVWEIQLAPGPNKAPTDISLSVNEIQENQPAGTTVATLSGIDDGASLTFALVDGEGSIDNSSFVVEGTSLKTNEVFVYENKSSYSIRIRVTDGGGLTYEKTFTISILPGDNNCNGSDFLVAGNISFPYHSAQVDQAGNYYMTGAFSGSINIGAQTLAAIGGKDIFLSKYDPCGNVLWAVSGGSAGDDTPGTGNGIAVDKDGNIFLVGRYRGPFSFKGTNGQNFTAGYSAGDDGFILKLSSSGIIQWGGTVTGGSNDGFWDVVVDALGNPVAGGQFNGCCPASFNATITGVGNSISMSSYGSFYSTAFITKFSSSGSVLWKSTLHNRDAENTALATDVAGNVYAAGTFRSWGSGTQAEFIDATGTKYFLPNPGIGLSYFVKLNSSGGWQWGTSLGNSGDGTNSLTGVGAIALDKDGNPWLSGFYSGSAATFYSTNNANLSTGASAGNSGFIVKYAPTGVPALAKTYQKSGLSTGFYGLTYHKGNIYASGFYAANSTYVYDLIYAVFSADGSLVNSFTGGSTGDDQSVGIYSNGSKLILTGSVSAQAVVGTGSFPQASTIIQIIDPGVSGPQDQQITLNETGPKTYGDPVFEISATASSGLPVELKSSDETTLKIIGNTATILKSGTVVISASQSGNSQYLAAAPVSQTLVINKAVLTATAENKSKTYGDSNPAFTISYTGFRNNETASVIDTPPIATSAATASSNAGEYPITVSGGTDNNYTFTYTSGTLTVNKATLTATADNKARVYGDANPALTISYSGFKNSETASVIDAPPAAATTATATSNAGAYPITVTGGTDNNYSFTYTSGTLTVNKATLTATADNKARIYGDVNPVFTLTYTGFKNNETATVIDTPPTATAAATVTSNVGTYPITVSGGLDNNYAFAPVNGTLTVNKAPLTATANDQSRSYGDPNPALTITYAGFKNSETSSVIDTPPAAATTATVTSNAGTYPITLSVGTDNNYTLTNVNGTLTVTKATVTVIVNSASRSYGDPNPPFSASYSGFRNGESSAVLDTPPTLTTAATAASNVGSYPITASGGTDNNYLLSYTNGTLTIDKATLVVTADNKAKVYGDVNPAFTLSYNGFKNSETAVVIDTPPTATTLATTSSNVGVYPITIAVGIDNNYSFNYSSGTLTISQAVVNATAENKSRLYGDANPVLTITYSGFRNNETSSVLDTPPSAITTAAANSNVGTYPIVVTGGQDNNYAISYTNGTLTVNKAILTAKADDLSRPYDTENPVLSITYSGFKNNETISVIDAPPVASTSATRATMPGSYPITLSGGSDNNYNLTLQNGTLTVTKLAQTVAFTLPPVLFEDQSPYTLTATSSSGGAIAFNIVSGNGIVNGNLLTITGPGNITVRAVQSGTNIYEAAEAFASTNVSNSYIVSGLITKPTNIPLGSGLAKLFYENGGLAKNGPVINGNYSITLVRPGRYVLQVIPLGNEESNVFPAYYNAVQLSKDATVIVVAGDMTVSMEMPGKSQNNDKGPGEIKGKVLSGNSGGGRFVVGRIAGGTGLANVPVYLLEPATDKVLRTVNTDKEGDFVMTELPVGNYRLGLDVVGATLANTATGISITAQNPVLEVSAVISESNSGTPVVGLEVDVITSVQKKEQVVHVYPNPGEGDLMIRYAVTGNEEISFSLTDMNGKIMSRKSELPNTDGLYILPLGDLELSKGVYLLQVSQGSELKTVKVIR